MEEEPALMGLRFIIFLPIENRIVSIQSICLYISPPDKRKKEEEEDKMSHGRMISTARRMKGIIRINERLCIQSLCNVVNYT